jgi:hypothetical protein
MQRVFGAEARLSGSLSRLARPLYAVAARDDVSQRAGFEHLGRGWRGTLYSAARSVGRRLDARSTVARLCRLEERLSQAWPDFTYETIAVRELAGVRRRAHALGSEAILAQLLR